MITESLPLWLVVTVIFIALLAGTSCIGTTNVVWFRHRVFGAGGSLLSFCGVVLIGLSVWGNVQIEGEGWKLNLKRVAAALETEPGAVQELISEIVRNDPELGAELARELVARDSQMVFETVALLASNDRNVRREFLVAISEPSNSEWVVNEAANVKEAVDHFAFGSETRGVVEVEFSACEMPNDDSDIVGLKIDEYANSGVHPQRYTWYKFEPSVDGLYTIDVASLADGGDTVLFVYGPGTMDKKFLLMTIQEEMEIQKLLMSSRLINSISYV